MPKIVCLCLLTLLVSSCKTSHELTTIRIEHDSTTKHVRDSMTAVMQEYKQKTQLEIEAIKNTGVTFQQECPPTQLTIDANCNYDSVQRIINSLKNSVKINKDGSIEAFGRLAGAYSNYDSIRHESASKDSIIQHQSRIIESDSSAIRSLQSASHTIDKSKPGGIFGALPWILVVVAFIAGIIIGYKQKPR